MSDIQTSYLTHYNEDSISILMTVPELAKYLNIGRNGTYVLLRNKGFKIGSTWCVIKAAVNDYILHESGLK